MRIGAGDAAAEAELVETFHRRVFAFAWAKTHDREAAKDLTQEVLCAAIIAFRKGQLREADKVPNFILGIARNTVNNHFRTEHARQEQEMPDEDRLCELADIEVAEQVERSLIVRNAIGQLPLEEQRVLLMTLVEGLKPGEIATRLGASSEVVRARKSRALKKLTKALNSMSHSSTTQPHPSRGTS